MPCVARSSSFSTVESPTLKVTLPDRTAPRGQYRFEFRIMGTFVIRDRKIARYTDYYDSPWCRPRHGPHLKTRRSNRSPVSEKSLPRSDAGTTRVTTPSETS